MKKNSLVLILVLFFAKMLLAQENKHIEKLQRLDSLAGSAFMSSNIEKAIRLSKEALDYAVANFKVGDTMIMKMQSAYGYTLMQKGNYVAAEPFFSTAIKTAEQYKKENTKIYLEIIGNRGMNYYYAGNFESAEASYKKLIKLIEAQKPINELSYAQVVNNLAVLYVDQKRFDEAEPLYLLAMKIRKEALGEKNASYAQSIGNLAILYRNIGRFDEAEKMNLENLKIQKSLSERGYALGLNNLAVYYLATNQQQKALPLLIESLNIRKKIHGTAHPQYAHALNNLGPAYDYFEEYDKAEACLKEAMTIREKLYPAQHPDLLETYNNLAYLYFDMGKKLEMSELLQKSIKGNGNLKELPTEIDSKWSEIIDKTEFTNLKVLISSLNLLLKELKVALQMQPKDLLLLDKALRISKAVVLSEEKMRRSFSTEGDKMHNISDFLHWTGTAVKYATTIARLSGNGDEEGFVYAERNKSLLLLGAMKAQKARAFGDLPDSLMQKEQALQKELGLLKKELIELKNEENKADKLANLSRLMAEAKQFQKELETKYPKYYKLKYTSSSLQAKEIQQLLSAKAAMIEYFVSDSSVFVFTVTAKKVSVKELKIDFKTLKEKTKNFRKALNDYDFIQKNSQEAYQLYTETAFWFYKTLLEPSLLEIKDIEQLIIIPDAELGHIPFESFLTEKPSDVVNYIKLPYLLNHYKISYNYAAALWKENMEQPKKKNNAKLFAAAPEYSAAANHVRAPKERDQNLLKLRDALQDLPAARKEVTELSKLFAGRFLLNNDASELAFKSEAENYAIIHLAMHGLLNTQYPILSSLAFTENGDSTEDNFLQAYEISQLKLNAELVVLSACETGYGKFQKGEGVLSLARSFMYAGVPSLVVSLWQVNDASTSQIMQLFYKNLSKGMDKAEALQRAKMQYICSNQTPIAATTTAHPAYWAPFIQIGDSRPIKVHQKMQYSGLLWLSLASSGGLLLLFALLFSRRKRALKA